MISTKGRYALRVMVDLAQQEQGSFVPLEAICERQGISKKYLEIILKTLVKENLLQGVRGKGGGYRLTRAPSKYTVWDILEPAEGTLATVACLRLGAEPCLRKDICATRPIWEQFDRMAYDFFSHITLEDLAAGNIKAPLGNQQGCSSQE